ncbi:heavy-metal-associated domain-containing protein [Paeniroseomonas aquatica]
MADGGTAQLTSGSGSALRYHVEGMDCPSCASKIETAVGRFGGAEDIRVNYHSQVLAFRLDEAATPRSAVEEGIASSATASLRSRRRESSRASLGRVPSTWGSFAPASPGGRERRRGSPRQSAPSWRPVSPSRWPPQPWTTGFTCPLPYSASATSAARPSLRQAPGRPSALRC